MQHRPLLSYIRRLACGLFVLALLAAGHAFARDEIQLPEPTSAGLVSLYFFKLTGQTPDFALWARESDAYRKANDFDKELVAREKAAEASGAFQLLTFDDPIVVRTKVALDYSRARKGFFIRNFKQDTFYSYHFVDRDYALVPLGIMDYQWIPVPDAAALEKINAALKADQKNEVLLYMSVAPNFADGAAPMKSGDKSYWLLSGKIKRMRIYDSRGRTLLWESYSQGEMDENQKQLLDLYK